VLAWLLVGLVYPSRVGSLAWLWGPVYPSRADLSAWLWGPVYLSRADLSAWECPSAAGWGVLVYPLAVG
jgi:hypothetical protein